MYASFVHLSRLSLSPLVILSVTYQETRPSHVCYILMIFRPPSQKRLYIVIFDRTLLSPIVSFLYFFFFPFSRCEDLLYYLVYSLVDVRTTKYMRFV